MPLKKSSQNESDYQAYQPLTLVNSYHSDLDQRSCEEKPEHPANHYQLLSESQGNHSLLLDTTQEGSEEENEEYNPELDGYELLTTAKQCNNKLEISEDAEEHNLIDFPEDTTNIERDLIDLSEESSSVKNPTKETIQRQGAPHHSSCFFSNPFHQRSIQHSTLRLAPMDEIMRFVEPSNLRIMALDIDETLLHYNEPENCFELKLYDSWIERMKQAERDDIKNNTLTVWTIATFRNERNGILQSTASSQEILCPEIDLLFEAFKSYINLNLIFATGGKGPEGTPHCKISTVLNYYHRRYHVPLANITIFDDQIKSVIAPAITAGIKAVPIAIENLNIASNTISPMNKQIRRTTSASGDFCHLRI